MTDIVFPSPGRGAVPDEWAAISRYGHGESDGWVVDPSRRLVSSAYDSSIASGALGGFALVSSAASSFEITIDTGEAVVGGRYVARDTQTTVTVPSNATTTVVVGVNQQVRDDVVVDTAGSADVELPLVDVTTDGAGVTGTSDRRALGPEAEFERARVTTAPEGATDVARKAEVGANATDISANATDISANATDISTNASDISANASDISTNASDINSLQSDVTVPSGGIVMWSGSSNNIPNGWTLCDGTDGAPDLRDRFIVGAGNQYSSGDTGGSDSVQLSESEMPSHDHTGSTTTDGSHNHGIDVNGFDSPRTDRITASGNEQTGDPYPTNEAGSHNHSLKINNAGGDQSHENRPPYYALAFIYKL